jgi:phi13 family phage major tail protein
MANNKVQFGLKDVHYAKVYETVTTTGTVTTYGSYAAWPGAVNLTLDAAGSENTFFDADDGIYYTIPGANNGYTGTFESALVPEDVEINVFGRTKNADGVIVETSEDKIVPIALAFSIDGDQSNRLYTLYKVQLNRASKSATTKPSEGGATPQTDSVTFAAIPRPGDNKIVAKTSDTTSTSVKEGWFGAVYE